MKVILSRLIQHEYLEKEEAKQVLVNIAKGEYKPAQIAAFLTVFMMRPVNANELEGFRSALLELCLPVDLTAFDPIDLCGTGGDGKDTFNISTLASFVTAGAGVPVAKHGNYGVSSSCGSSNVMEHLGIRFSNEEAFLQNCIEKAGICVLHAPLFHPAMKNVAPIRRELGVKTFFNMLGPMVNPSFPKHQLVGVFNLELARLYGYLYQNTDKRYTIVHALAGYDEIALTGPAKIIRNAEEALVNPSDFGLQPLTAQQIAGGESVPAAANIFMDILQGHGSQAQEEVVCANAALAIATRQDCELAAAYDQAHNSLKSGQALHAFETLQKLSAQ